MLLLSRTRLVAAAKLARFGQRASRIDSRNVRIRGEVLLFARRFRLFLAGVGALVLTLMLSRPAHAQRIILLCPPEADASLTEAFNRLRGELSMHGFEVEVQTSAEAISPENLASRADSVAAVASVSFVRSAAGLATADIKISDRVTGKMTTRTIATPEGTDAASLLALRAVELLRASLREFGPAARAPKDIVGAAPDRASPSVREFAEAKPTVSAENVAPPPKPAKPVQAPKPAPAVKTARPEAAPEPEPIPEPVAPPMTEAHWSLRADALGAALLPGAHAAYGAGLAIGFRPSSRFELQLSAEAPWFGTHYSTAHAKTDMHLITAAGGLAYSITASRHAELQVQGGLGLTRVTMFTTTVQPLLPMLPSAWLLMPRVGVGVSVLLSRRFFWQTNAMVAALLPPTRLHLDDRRFNVGMPILQVSSGLGVRF